jgi:hypothetical protein
MQYLGYLRLVNAEMVKPSSPQASICKGLAHDGFAEGAFAVISSTKDKRLF